MTEWRNAPREIVLASDDPVIWAILEAHFEQRPLNFRYFGGTGDSKLEVRVCVPEIVFRIKGFSSTWFEGFCQTRNARRVFNCARVDILPPGWGQKEILQCYYPDSD